MLFFFCLPTFTQFFLLECEPVPVHYLGLEVKEMEPYVSYALTGLASVGSIGIGIIGYFIKRQMNHVEDALTRNEKTTKEQSEALNKRINQVEENTANDVAAVRKELNDLKTDLPFVYTLREDFIRTMNTVEMNMSKIENKIEARTGAIEEKLDKLLSK